MIQLGLTGHPLGHSLSPDLHAAALRSVGLEGEYKLYPIAPDDPVGLPQLLGRVRSGELQGLNVTIPHKQVVIPFLDELSPSARAIGAVNTIYKKDGKLIGHNTDAPGFAVDLQRSLGVDINVGFGALVLGAGGAARAVVYALLTGGWDVTLAVRAADVGMAETLIHSFKRASADRTLRFVLLEPDALSPLLNDFELLVNTTPLGMSPDVTVSPWPDGLSFPHAAIYDVVYNPRVTALVRHARAVGLRAETGLGMLVSQAALSFETWTGRAPSIVAMFAAVHI
ncbi:MAG: shikimate dehydrogenase [Anaerolineales bacterium]